MTGGRSWVDEVMATVAHVNWAKLHHGYGSAELTPLALRAWLENDDGARAEVSPGHEAVRSIADMPGRAAAESSLDWIVESVFRNGGLSSTSALVCRVMVAALEFAPTVTVRAEALRVLNDALGGDPHEDWKRADYEPVGRYRPATHAEVVAGAPAYLSAIGRDRSNEERRLGAKLLALLPDRDRSTARIIEVLEAEPDPASSRFVTVAEAKNTAILLRTLGIVARGAADADRAEVRLRPFLDQPDPVGLAACLGLARMHGVRETDGTVVERLRSALLTGGRVPERSALLDALITIELHCGPPDKSRSERVHAALREAVGYVESFDVGDRRARLLRQDAMSTLRAVTAHHGIAESLGDL